MIRLTQVRWAASAAARVNEINRAREACLSGVGGFEPPTAGLGTRCPIQTRLHAPFLVPLRAHYSSLEDEGLEVLPPKGHAGLPIFR